MTELVGSLLSDPEVLGDFHESEGLHARGDYRVHAKLLRL